MQKINPDAVRQIDNEGSKLHGKLVVDHNTVLYTAVAGLQELSGIVVSLLSTPRPLLFLLHLFLLFHPSLLSSLFDDLKGCAH